MKNPLFILLTASLSFSSFNRPAFLTSDHRDSYVGNYLCIRSCQRLHPGQESVIQDDTTSISIAKDRSDSILNISIGRSIYQFKLKNETMRAYGGTHGQGKFFSTDSIALGLSTSLSGGVCSYKGRKK